jgi:phospholipase D1/2
MPFLLPPADFTHLDLEKQRIMGTCETQICRSCGPWSMGTPKKVEHSIQTAYIKAIQMSDHFVYIGMRWFMSIFRRWLTCLIVFQKTSSSSRQLSLKT